MHRDMTLFDGMARRVVRWGLTAPAILFLEGAKPLGFAAGQFLRCAAPALGFFVPLRVLDAWADALEERDGIERLVARIEAMAAAGDEGGHEGA